MIRRLEKLLFENLEWFTTVFDDTRLWKTKHTRKHFQNFRQSSTLSRGSPIPLSKTVSRQVFGLFTHHEKIKKQLHVHRKKQAITFHVKMHILFTFRKTYKYNHYKSFMKHLTEMCHSRYSYTWPSFCNFRLFSSINTSRTFVAWVTLW